MNDPLNTTTSVLLIAHGSRRQEANEELKWPAAAIRERGLYRSVAISYLEIAHPTIAEGARDCVKQGARRVLMMPYFLSSGAHVVEDLQRHRRELSSEHPEVSFELCQPLGLHPLLVEVVLDRLQEMGESEW